MKRLLLALLMFTPAFAQRGGPTTTVNVTMPTCAAITGACPAQGYVCALDTSIYRCWSRVWTAIGSAATVEGGGLTNGNKGDIIVAQDGESLQIAAGAVGLDEMAPLAQNAFIIRTSSGTGTPQTAVMTPYARTLVDDANYLAARSTLQLVPGTDVQAYDADLDDLADGLLTGSKVDPATSSQVGGVSLSAQTMGAGVKTFPDGIAVSCNASAPGRVTWFETGSPCGNYVRLLGNANFTSDYSWSWNADGTLPIGMIDTATLLKTSGSNVATGTYDIGDGALEIPNGTSTTTPLGTTPGRIMLDTDCDGTNVTTPCLMAYGAAANRFFLSMPMPTVNGRTISYNSATHALEWVAPPGAGSGTVMKVDTGADMGTADFQDGGDINFTNTEGVVTADIKAGAITDADHAANSITGDSIASSIAGKGLALTAGSPDVIDLTPMSETFTLFDINGLADTTDLPSIKRWAAPVTITEVWCETDSANASTITLEKDGGADLTTACSCTSTPSTCTLTTAGGGPPYADRQYAADTNLDFVFVTVGGTTNRLNVSVKYTVD